MVPRPIPVKLIMNGIVTVAAPIVAANKFKTDEFMFPAVNGEELSSYSNNKVNTGEDISKNLLDHQNFPYFPLFHQSIGLTKNDRLYHC